MPFHGISCPAISGEMALIRRHLFFVCSRSFQRDNPVDKFVGAANRQRLSLRDRRRLATAADRAPTDCRSGPPAVSTRRCSSQSASAMISARPCPMRQCGDYAVARSAQLAAVSTEPAGRQRVDARISPCDDRRSPRSSGASSRSPQCASNPVSAKLERRPQPVAKRPLARPFEHRIGEQQHPAPAPHPRIERRPIPPPAARAAARQQHRARRHLARQVDRLEPVMRSRRNVAASPLAGRARTPRRTPMATTSGHRARASASRCGASDRHAASTSSATSAAAARFTAGCRSRRWRRRTRPVRAPISASGSLGSAGAALAIVWLAAAASTLQLADRRADQHQHEHERQAGQADADPLYASFAPSSTRSPDLRFDHRHSTNLCPIRRNAIPSLDVRCPGDAKASMTKPPRHPLGRRRRASRLRQVRPYHHRRGPYDPQANAVANAAPVAMPPAIVASKTYRCKDNSLVYIDWLADGRPTRPRRRRAVPPTALKSGRGRRRAQGRRLRADRPAHGHDRHLTRPARAAGLKA